MLYIIFNISIVYEICYSFPFSFRLGEVCSHTAALLFALESIVANGIQTLPSGKTCTEKLCEWLVPKGRKVIYFFQNEWVISKTVRYLVDLCFGNLCLFSLFM